MKDMFTQCKMKKGDTWQTAWIPSRHAMTGKVLKLKEEDGWIVMETGTTVDANRIPTMRDTYRYHRKTTDI